MSFLNELHFPLNIILAMLFFNIKSNRKLNGEKTWCLFITFQIVTITKLAQITLFFLLAKKIYLLKCHWCPCGVSNGVWPKNTQCCFVGRCCKIQIEQCSLFCGKKILKLGKLPGLVVNIEDSQSEPWSSDVGLITGFT